MFSVNFTPRRLIPSHEQLFSLKNRLGVAEIDFAVRKGDQSHLRKDIAF